MAQHHFRSTLVVLVVLTLTSSVVAQPTEALTPDEPSAAKSSDDSNPYAALRKSRNRATKALAERYADLIGTQEWTDAKGKFKTRARYVRHDPELKSVTLANTTGHGADRIVKEVTVQVSRLSKSSQSRVRQIAALQKKLDELAADEQPEPTFTGFTANPPGSDSGARRAHESGRRGAAADDDQAAGPNLFQWATSYAAFRANFKPRLASEPAIANIAAPVPPPSAARPAVVPKNEPSLASVAELMMLPVGLLPPEVPPPPPLLPPPPSPIAPRMEEKSPLRIAPRSRFRRMFSSAPRQSRAKASTVSNIPRNA